MAKPLRSFSEGWQLNLVANLPAIALREGGNFFFLRFNRLLKCDKQSRKTCFQIFLFLFILNLSSVDSGRFELLISSLQTRRFNQLSYGPWPKKSRYLRLLFIISPSLNTAISPILYFYPFYLKHPQVPLLYLIRFLKSIDQLTFDFINFRLYKLTYNRHHGN